MKTVRAFSLCVLFAAGILIGCGGGGGETASDSGGPADESDSGTKTLIDAVTGENIFALAVNPDDPDMIIASTFGSQYSQGRVFKTTDGGRRWKDVGLNRSISCILFDPHQPGRVIAGGFKLYISSDYGDSWEAHPHKFGDDCLSMAAGEISDDIFIVQNARGYHDGIEVLRSDGSIATIAENLSDIYHVECSGDGSGRLFVLCADGVYVSENDGVDWKRIADGATVRLFDEDPWHSRLVLSPSDADRIVVAGGDSIYSTGDGGRNWTDISPDQDDLVGSGEGFPLVSSISDIGVLSSGREYIYAVYNNFIARRTWVGDWELVAVLDKPWLKNWSGSGDGRVGVMGYVNQIDVHRSSIEDNMFLATFEGVFRLGADEGQLQALGSTGMTDVSVSALQFNPYDADELLFGTRLFGVYTFSEAARRAEKINDGFTWQFTTIRFENSPCAYINALSVGSPGADIIACMSGGAYLYDAAGERWDKLLNGNEFESELYAFAIDVNNADRMYAKTATVFLHTHDGGNDWVRHDFMVGEGEVLLDDNDPSTVVVTEHGGTESIDISRDGGATFSPAGWLLYSGDIVQAAKINDPAFVVYVLKYNRLYKITGISQDDGQADILLEGGTFGDPFVAFAVNPDNPNQIAAARTTDILITNDEGDTWKTVAFVEYGDDDFYHPPYTDAFEVSNYQGEEIRRLIFSRRETDLLYVGTSWGLYRLEM